MKPVRTKACNATFTAEGCSDLPAAIYDGFVATYWRPTLWDLMKIAFGRPIRLSVQGNGQPPVAMDSET